MLQQKDRIVLKGRNYAAPKTESIEIVCQGVLCGSGLTTAGGVGSSINSLVTGSSRAGGSIKSWN